MNYAYRYDLDDLTPSLGSFLFALVVLDIKKHQLFFPRYQSQHRLWRGVEFYKDRGYVVLTTLSWDNVYGWHLYEEDQS